MKRGMVVGLLAICVLLGAGVVGNYMTGDRQGPKITIPGDSSLTYVEGMDSQLLLEGVEAVDKREGDVSDSLVIENILPNIDKTQASIIYVAKDSKNNVTKKTRTVNYQTSVSEAPNQGENEQQDDGNENQNPGQDEPTDGGESQVNDVTPEPTNEAEGGEAANEATIASLPAESPKFYLTNYELNLPVGSSFNGLSYVKDIADDKDSRERLYRNIQIEGNVDSSKSGTYEIHYYVKDSDGNMSNVAILKVTVQ